MKNFILALSLVAAAAAASAAERVLPQLSVVDKDGASVSLTAPGRGAPWALLVVDAARPQTASALERLHKRDGGWGGNLVVVVEGDAAAYRALVASHARMTGVRWYRDADGSARKSMKLPGMPALLGIGPDNSIAWQTNGLPAQPDKAQSLVGAWIAKAPRK